MINKMAMNCSEILMSGFEASLLWSSLWSVRKEWRCSDSDPLDASFNETRSVKMLGVESPPASSCCLHSFRKASRGEVQFLITWKFSESTVICRAVSAVMLFAT